MRDHLAPPMPAHWHCDTQTWRNRDGLSLSYRERPGQGPTLLLLHGLGNESSVWADFVADIAPGWRVVMPDLRGHGASAHAVDGDYAMQRFVDDVADLVKLLGLRQIVVAGHSLGGAIAAHFALEQRPWLRGLALIDAGPDAAPESMSRVRGSLPASTRRFDTPAQLAQLLADIYPMSGSDTLLRLANHALRPCAGGGYRLALDAAVAAALTAPLPAGAPSIWQRLGEIDSPLLIIRGEASSLLSEAAALTMRATARRAAVATVRAAGHAVMLDNPDGFAAAMRGFLGALGGEA